MKHLTRSHRALLATSLTVVGLVAACSGSSGPGMTADPGSSPAPDGGPSTGGGLPCDVDHVLQENCRSCHGASPAFGAPMPLVTTADLHAAAKSAPDTPVFEMVGTRIHSEGAPMPPPPNAPLSEADVATLDTWIAAGAPASTEACNAPGSDGGALQPSPLTCTPDQRLRPTSKFKVPQTEDVYVCYGFDTTAEGKRHVIAGAPHIDNTRVVHHVLVYQSDEAVSGTPTNCGAGGGRGWRLITGWAPGGSNFELPVEAGFPEENGVTHWAIQIHYNNAQGLLDQEDASGFDFCSTDQLRPNDADILATGTVAIDIPPRSTTETTCELTFPQAYGTINVVSSWAHMHRLGRAQYAKRIRGGVEATLLDAPNYDFNVGGGATAVNVDVAAGDTVRTMCRWTNPGTSSVKFGEGTADEMCFAFLTYWPKITAQPFHWMAPSLPIVSKCTSTQSP